MGRPLSIITQQNIHAVQDLVKEDPHISIDYIATTLDISHGSADTILKQYLGLRMVSSTANHAKLHHDNARPHMNK